MARSALLVILFAFSATVNADGFNYNSLTASYGQIEADDFNVDGDNLSIGASAAVGENFFVFGNYGYTEFEELGLSLELDELSAGIGYHTPMSDYTDLVASVSYEYAEATLPLGIGTVDDNGFGLGLGFRYAANDQFEVDAGIKYVDLNDFGDETFLDAKFLFNLTENFSVGVGGQWSDDTTAYAVGGRFYFGN